MNGRSRLLICTFALLWVLQPFMSDAMGQERSDTLSAASQPANEPISEEQRADRALESRLTMVFDEFERFRRVRVNVKAGVVRLSGIVPSAEVREQAESLASKLPDVLFVVNELESDTDLETRVSPAIENIQDQARTLVAYLPIIGIALLVLVIFWMLGRWAGRLEKPLARLGIPPMLRTLIGRLVSVVVFIIGLVLALDILGVATLVGTVLGAAGVAGIAIGFAFKDIVENYLAGILLSIRRPFSLNDHIKIDDVEGKVLSLSSRELLLMTLDGNHVRLPNSTVFKGTIFNYTRNPRRRFDFSVGVGSDEDLVLVSELGLATLKAIPGIMEDPGPAMIIRELGDSNVVVTFFAWVDQDIADFGKVRSAGIRLVKTAYDEAEISMPEPIYSIRMEDVTPAERAPGAADRESKPRQPRSEPTAAVLEQAGEADTKVVTELDEQIQEDLDSSSETNYLKDD